MEFAIIALSAVLVEAVLNILKETVSGGKVSKTVLASIALGVVFTLAYNIDLFSAVGLVATVPYIGNVLSGIIISRGSNFVADLVKKLQGSGE